ncbi:MAG: ATP-binding protein, partial [Bdellovibrionota bacterium]
RPSPSGLPAAPVVPVLARGPELHEALANLVHNAIAYTPSGGHITVRVSIVNGMALAEVCDDGPGIAKAQRAAVGSPLCLFGWMVIGHLVGIWLPLGN